ncbi:hypothetical protein NMY22_g16668 [Coprinellus aureogranulatus]|nr:hypothetical protein NMY22_g16668 [Coprinellus aureogranulatus]
MHSHTPPIVSQAPPQKRFCGRPPPFPWALTLGLGDSISMVAITSAADPGRGAMTVWARSEFKRMVRTMSLPDATRTPGYRRRESVEGDDGRVLKQSSEHVGRANKGRSDDEVEAKGQEGDEEKDYSQVNRLLSLVTLFRPVLTTPLHLPAVGPRLKYYPSSVNAQWIFAASPGGAWCQSRVIHELSESSEESQEKRDETTSAFN